MLPAPQNVHLIEATEASIIIGWEPHPDWDDEAHYFDVRRNGNVIAENVIGYTYTDTGADQMMINEYEVRGRLWFLQGS